ncbi:MAG: polysaccharide deacetylase family protein [Chitinophagaceae bacterium]
MRFPARIPSWVKWVYPSFVWQMPGDEKALYLTFDDGPHPTITPIVLDLLSKYNAKATFFCIGDRAKRYPEILQRIRQEGHAIGNHTQHHVNGWATLDRDYIDQVNQAAEFIPSKLFRPPYGRIKRNQAGLLQKEGYKVVMWTILSADYDHKLSKEECLSRVVRRIESGDIYLFHDSEKGEERMLAVLPSLLKVATDKGFLFKKIEEVR